MNGSRFPLDRERVAALLGFPVPIAHTRDAMWQTDGLVDLVSHAAIAATGASRFAEDLELYGSDEFGLLRIGDELCRASALMPQKRNPYALVVLRGGAGHADRPGHRRDGDPAHAVRAARTTCSTPTARSPERSSSPPGCCASRRRPPRASPSTASEPRARCATSFALGHRPRGGDQPGHRARLPLRLPRRGPRAWPAAASTPRRSTRPPLRSCSAARSALDPLCAEALDPAAALAARTVPGGAAPEPMDAMLAECRAAVAEARAWIEAARAASSAAEDASSSQHAGAGTAQRGGTALGSRSSVS